MHHDLLKPRHEFCGRLGRRDGERRDADDDGSSDPVSADPDATGRAGSLVQADAIDRSAMRRAACLGLVLAALTHASGCGFECDMDREFVLTVEPVDENGVHLPIQALEAALESGKIEICVDGLESYCLTDPWLEFLRDKRMFELRHSDLAYPERRHCELPTVTFSFELPGCEPAEYVLHGGETTNQVKFETHTDWMKIVCPGV